MPNFSRSVALVIGINEYSDGIPRLRTAVNDAVKVAEQLENKHGYEVVLLRDGEATGAGLRELLGTGLADLTERDRLLVYFAGHGVALDGDDGPEGFLLLQDAQASDPGSFFGMTELHRLLAGLGCRHLLVVLDCCFAGAFRWSSTRHFALKNQVMYVERYERFTRDAAWQVLASAAYDQKALDVVDGRAIGIREEQALHSPFAATLLKALDGEADLPSVRGRGDGVITATELYVYLRDNIEVTKVGRARQTPSLWPLQKHDKGEYVFQTPGVPLDLPPAPELNRESNPFRGLEPFERQHQKFFFGRKRVTAELRDHVGAHAFTLVLGASGSGKSSLVKAGLVPALGGTWEPMILRPGKHPLQALEKLELPEPKAPLARRAQAWLDMHPTLSLLLVVDQFEELITLADAAEALAFQGELAGLLPAEPAPSSAPVPDPGHERLRMVVTLRSDFAPQFATGPLHEWWMKGRFLIPSLSQNEIREAIEGPAAVQVIYYEPPSLVDTLINEVSQTPGALPLLSFTLSELYLKYLERRAGNRAMTQADYEELGGVAGSLRHRANAEYDSLKDELHRETMRRIMLRMVSMEGGELARRRVPKEELEYIDAAENKRVDAVLECLSTARLIVSDSEPDGTAVVEPAHDALVRGWDKLLEWKREAAEEIRLRQLLTTATEDWRKNGGGLWDDNPRLEQLRPAKDKIEIKGELKLEAEPAVKAVHWMNRHERAFVDASLSKRRRKRVTLASSVAVVTIGLLSLGAVLWISNQNLKASNTLAAKRRADYHATASLALAEQPTRVMHSLGQACLAAHSMPPSDYRQEVYLQRMLSLAKFAPDSIVNVGWPVKTAVFSPDLDKVLVTSDDGEFLLIEPQRGEPFLPPRHEAAESYRVPASPRFGGPVFSDDGKRIAAVLSKRGENGLVYKLVVWECGTGEAHVDEILSGILNLEEEEIGVFYHPDSLAFTPDGKHVGLGYSSGLDETFVKIWSCESGSEQKLASPRVSTKQFEEQNPLVLGNGWIAIAGKEEGSVRIEPFAESTLPPGGRDFTVVGEIKGLIASRDSNHLAVITGFDLDSPKSRSRPRPAHTGTLSILDAKTGEFTHTMARNEVIGSSWIKNPIALRSARGDRIILIDPGRRRCSILDFRDDSPAANFSIRMSDLEMVRDRGLPVGTSIAPSMDSTRLLLSSWEKFESWNLDPGVPALVEQRNYLYPSEQASLVPEQSTGTKATTTFRFPCNQVISTAVRNDEKLLAAVDKNGGILCWKLPVAASGEVIGTLSPEVRTMPIEHAQFAPDKKTLVCSLSDWTSRGSHQEIGYWPVAPDAKFLWNERASEVPVRYSRSSLAVNPASGLVAFSIKAFADDLHWLKLGDGKLLPSSGVYVADMIGFTRNGSLAFAGQTSDGYETGIIPSNMIQKAAGDESTLPPRFPGVGTAIALCANPEYLVIHPSGDSTINKRRRAISRTSDGTRITPFLKFSNDALTLMAESIFAQATDFQVTPKELMVTLEGGAIFKMPLSPVSGDENCLVDIDYASPQRFTSSSLKREQLLYPPDGRSVLTVEWEVSWWELATGEPMAQQFPHETSVVGATLSENGRDLLTVTQEGVIRRWPITLPTRGAREWLEQLGEALTGLDFSKPSPIPLPQKEFKEIRAKVVKQVKAAAAKGDTCAEELLRHFER